MAFNVNQFTTHFGKYGDLAKTDKFDVFISVPNALTSLGFGARELSFQCEAAELPGKNITMIEQRHYAFINRVPYQIVYPEISLTFYCNGQLQEKKFFDAWFDSMIPTATGLVNYYSDDSGSKYYTAPVTINQYSQSANEDGSPRLIYACQLIDAIPTSIASLPLNWSEDSVHRLQVSFAYRKWTNVEVPDYVSTGTEKIANYSNRIPNNE